MPPNALTARDNLFWGNSLNPLEPRTTLTRAADGSFRLNGEKSFNTGAQDSDLLLVSAVEPGRTTQLPAVGGDSPRFYPFATR
jgi:alkylation response protein AidB-like acyl-CoA dehydrogenase